MEDTNGNGDISNEPTLPQKPRRDDFDGRLTLLEREAQGVREELRDLNKDSKAVLKAIGGLSTSVEKALTEVRSNAWQKRPVWIATIAWVAIAAAVVWAAYHSRGGG